MKGGARVLNIASDLYAVYAFH